MTRRATLRASDADRDLVAERLRQAATEGRLSADELDERLGAALSARTYGELDGLVADLPTPDRGLSLRPRGDVARRRPAAPVVLALVFAAMLIGMVASALGGHGHTDHGGIGAAPLIWLVFLAVGWRYIARRRGTR